MMGRMPCGWAFWIVVVVVALERSGRARDAPRDRLGVIEEV